MRDRRCGRRWTAAGAALACSALTFGLVTAQQPPAAPAPAGVESADPQPTTTTTTASQKTTVSSTRPVGAEQAELEALRAAGRKMQTQAAMIAGYPLIGAQVEVHLANTATTPLPRSHDANNGVGNNNFVVVGRLVAFDAHWVGLEAEDTSRIWLPREHVATVYEPPAGVGVRRPRQAPGAR
jgi:hypothetical protein